ncbi:hypothetical protein HWC54_gp114 [Klebsiella phage Marfa]|uniref:Uncharacterized protein n=1 Tax=Klebsiella phage Marfa TaxID=2587809 RepID=A0A4Y5TS08_9CAUD|nr:hypothetical protein HWC54_gp114 [Klebsiella phage Marfa]QDB71769.1 hypothetical protein CPT_Marfa_114 [Klebsiella phage Marfa]
MKTYKEFIAEANVPASAELLAMFEEESTEELNENLTTATPQVIRVRNALQTGMQARVAKTMKLAFTTSKNEDFGDGIAMNTGQYYVEWNGDTGTAKIRQTRAAGGKMLDVKLNVKEKDVVTLFKNWMKTYK